MERTLTNWQGWRILLACGWLALASGVAHAQELGPALDQEITDARAAIEAAVKDQAEKYAAAPLKQSRESVQAAEAARTAKDGKSASQAARIARALADLARASAATAIEAEKLAQTGEAIQKARQELETLQKQKL